MTVDLNKYIEIFLASLGLNMSTPNRGDGKSGLQEGIITNIY